MATGASAAVRRSLSYYYTGRSGGDVIGGESGSLGEEAPDALTVLTRPREHEKQGPTVPSRNQQPVARGTVPSWTDASTPAQICKHSRHHAPRHQAGTGWAAGAAHANLPMPLQVCCCRCFAHVDFSFLRPFKSRVFQRREFCAGFYFFFFFIT